MFKKILVATDGSDYGEKAVEVAAEMAANSNGELLILTVVPPLVWPQAMNSGAFVMDGEVIQMIRDSYSQILHEARESSFKWAVPKVETKLEDGPVAQVITQQAEVGNFDLIVMGSLGHSQAYSVFLGSVSDRVSRLAKTSVLVVR